MTRDWKSSTTSFMDCTGTQSEEGIEAFLDKIVSPQVFDISGSNFRAIYGSYKGQAFLALVIVHHTAKHYGGIVFGYSRTSIVQFSYTYEKYGIRFL